MPYSVPEGTAPTRGFHRTSIPERRPPQIDTNKEGIDLNEPHPVEAVCAPGTDKSIHDTVSRFDNTMMRETVKTGRG